MPRERIIAGLKSKLFKLPPPPLGKTIGHGLMKPAMGIATLNYEQL